MAKASATVSDDNVVGTTDSAPTPSEGREGVQSDFSNLCGQIAGLSVTVADDEDGPATPHAIQSAVELLFDAAPILAELQTKKFGRVSFPSGFAASDEKGGIRVEWRDTSHSLHLAIGPGSGHQTYVYFNDGGQKGLEDNVSSGRLAYFLLMFAVT